MQFNPPQRHALAWGAIALVVGLVLWVLGPVLMPFVVAAVLAYALNPVVRGLERVGKRLIPSIVAVLLVEIGFLVMVVAVLTMAEHVVMFLIFFLFAFVDDLRFPLVDNDDDEEETIFVTL